MPQLRTLVLDGEDAGVELGYVEWGPGDATRVIVCVHGLTRNSRDFDALAAVLAGRGARVIAVDVPGRGRSSWLPDPGAYAVPTYARQLGQLLARLGLGSVDWIGTSMGGLIGMVVAAGEAGLMIQRLVLNDIGPFVPRAALEEIAFYVGRTLSFPSMADLERHLRTVHAGFGRLTDAQWRHLAEHGARPDPAGWRLSYDPRIGEAFRAQTGADIDLWAVWDQVRCPVLVLRGAESPLLQAETLDAMRRREPPVDAVTIAATGHAPSLMAADQIETVAGWLGLPGVSPTSRMD